MSVTITLIGGPTALIEFDGFRLLTDPTFDAPGAYQLPHVKLEKLTGPAFGVDQLGEIDAVLLSHDQHSDNLDHGGRAFLARAPRVLTTEIGAGTIFYLADQASPTWRREYEELVARRPADPTRKFEAIPFGGRPS